MGVILTETIPERGPGEVRTALGYSLVACVGFAIDFLVLKAMLALGMQPAWARVFSLFAAMQATFLINGLYVFRCLARSNFVTSWLGYMTTNGLGNVCNYWLFVTLISLHHPWLSRPALAVAAGGVTAWFINYGCLRLLVFRRAVDSCTPVTEVGEMVLEGARDTADALGTGAADPPQVSSGRPSSTGVRLRQA